MRLRPGVLHGGTLREVLLLMHQIAGNPEHKKQEHCEISLNMMAVSNCSTAEEALLPTMIGDDDEDC